MRRTMICLVSLVAGLTMMFAGPASAAFSISKADVSAAMITPADLGGGWKRMTVPKNSDTDIQGCGANSSTTSVGQRFSVSRTFQYRASPLMVTEDVSTFTTVAAAKADMTKGIKTLQGCTSVTIDGQVWQIVRVSMPSVGDQRVRYQMSGTILTAKAGAVPVLAFFVVSRHGRHEITSTMFVAGALSPADKSVVAAASIRVGRLSTAKLAGALPR